MQITVSPRPGSLENAREFLTKAQGAAGDVLNAKQLTPDTLASLYSGVQNASHAAGELFLAPARSDFQDLVAARRQVLAGKVLLENAIVTMKTDLNLAPINRQELVFADVSDAFDAFENAFEIIDND